jgi:hypothetical protein
MHREKMLQMADMALQIAIFTLVCGCNIFYFGIHKLNSATVVLDLGMCLTQFLVQRLVVAVQVADLTICASHHLTLHMHEFFLPIRSLLSKIFSFTAKGVYLQIQVVDFGT